MTILWKTVDWKHCYCSYKLLLQWYLHSISRAYQPSLSVFGSPRILYYPCTQRTASALESSSPPTHGTQGRCVFWLGFGIMAKISIWLWPLHFVAMVIVNANVCLDGYNRQYMWSCWSGNVRKPVFVKFVHILPTSTVNLVMSVTKRMLKYFGSGTCDFSYCPLTLSCELWGHGVQAVICNWLSLR